MSIAVRREVVTTALTYWYYSIFQWHKFSVLAGGDEGVSLLFLFQCRWISVPWKTILLESVNYQPCFGVSERTALSLKSVGAPTLLTEWTAVRLGPSNEWVFQPLLSCERNAAMFRPQSVKHPTPFFLRVFKKISVIKIPCALSV